MKTTIKITCRDPIVSRDGRPFGMNQGNRMRAVNWPLPSVVAGSLRTLLGKVKRREFSLDTAKDLLQVEVSGLFPWGEQTEKLYFPAPNDCVISPDKGPLRACPQDYEGGCDWPAPGLKPVMLTTDDAREDFKPRSGPAWWPVDQYVRWLLGLAVTINDEFLQAPLVEERTHVHLDAATGVAAVGMLFTTAALSLTHLPRYKTIQDAPLDQRFAPVALLTRVVADNWTASALARLDALHPLGGERRLVHWNTANGNLSVWDCPKAVADALGSTNRVRMVLATPAIFTGGWKPGWLDHNLTGSPPESTVKLKLVGVCTQRWRAVSGWSLAPVNEKGQLDSQGKCGPKPVKRMVPAGGVYFFEVIDGTGAALAESWLRPVSDDEQDRRDGFGLALWGTW